MDGVQGVGALSADVKEWNADLLSVGGHKWMLSGEGVGFCYINKEKLEMLEPVGVCLAQRGESPEFLVGGGSPAPFDKPLAADATRFEGGTLNIAGIHALGRSAEVMLELGPVNIEEHILALGRRLAQGLMRMDYDVVSPQGDRQRSGITCFKSRNGDTGELLKRLREKNFSLGFPCGAIRVSPHYYNNYNDIDMLLAALEM